MARINLNSKGTTNEHLSIDVIDYSGEEQTIDLDTDGILYETKNGSLKINYPKFQQAFKLVNNCVFSNGLFYTPDGAISTEAIRQYLQQSLIDFGWVDRLDVPVNSSLIGLKDMCHVEGLSADAAIIPFANGDLYLDPDGWYFELGRKRHTPYRLAVDYTPKDKSMPNFSKWVSDVFDEQDIPTLQEMLGYALVPTTAVQEGFFIVGDGGVGKSVLGTILQEILGKAFYPMKTDELVTARFQLSGCENKLVVYDDDLGSAALTETGTLKKLISADQAILAERKYSQPYSFVPYCKVIACANFMLSSLYDDSDGFYRRLHPILVKPKDPRRKTIPRFGQRVAQEKEQIVRWALIGLQRLMQNNWQVTWSERSQNYFGKIKSQGVHYSEFIEDVFTEGEDETVTCKEIRDVYDRWCRENGIQNMSQRRMEKWLVDNAEKLHLKYSRSVRRGDKYVRGYTGLSVKNEWQNTIKL